MLADDYEDDEEEGGELGTSAQEAQTAVTDTVSKLKSAATGLAGVSVWVTLCTVHSIECLYMSACMSKHSDSVAASLKDLQQYWLLVVALQNCACILGR